MPIHESFKDTESDSGELACVALSHGKSGYFYLMGDGYWKFDGIPQEAASKILEKKHRHVRPRYGAFGDKMVATSLNQI